jgi:hypothetical protein
MLIDSQSISTLNTSRRWIPDVNEKKNTKLIKLTVKQYKILYFSIKLNEREEAI